MFLSLSHFLELVWEAAEGCVTVWLVRRAAARGPANFVWKGLAAGLRNVVCGSSTCLFEFSERVAICGALRKVSLLVDVLGICSDNRGRGLA